MKVCINYSGLSFKGLEKNLSLLHFEPVPGPDGVLGTADDFDDWVDHTELDENNKPIIDEVNNIICAIVDSLSFFAVFEQVLEVEIDIKPGSGPNCFNINGHGVIPVAILGSATFDVLDIDNTTLLFDGLKVRVRAKKGPLCNVEDVSGDLIPDLVCPFEDDPMNWIAAISTTATVTGTLLDGTSFEGTDSICVVP